MYVCLCKGITDRDIRNCIGKGARCMADLSRDLGIATECGICEAHARELLGNSDKPTATCPEAA